MINSILTNISSIRIQDRLNSSGNILSTTLERMSSGFKINSAKDDAAGCVISSKMNTKLNGLNIAQNNIQFGMSFLDTAQGAYDEISSILIRLRDLSLQASDSSYDMYARNAMQDEADELVKELERIKKTASFNDLKLFENYEKDDANGNNGDENTTNANGISTLSATTFASSFNDLKLFENYEKDDANGNNGDENTTNANGISALSATTFASNFMTNNLSVLNNEINTANLSATNSAQTPTTFSTAQKYSVDFGSTWTTKDIVINGINYSVSTAGVFEYEVDGDQITFLSRGAIKGDKNAQHNVVLKASWIYFYGGDKDDIIQNENDYNKIYTYGGNDKVILNKNVSTNYISLGDGDDEIITNGYNISNSTILGGSGNDELTGGGNIINSYIQNINNEKEKEYIELNNGETRTITIGGKEYAIYNWLSETNKFSYYYDKTNDKVIFAGDNIEITGQKDVSHNVELNGFDLHFYGGDKNDDITIQTGYDIYVYGGDGDDNIKINNCGASFVYGEEGDDTITANSYWATVDGGEGDDTITIGKEINDNTNYSQTGGMGDDTYYIEKTVEIKDNDGNNTYYIDTDGITLTTGSGNDKYIINANDVSINATGGNNQFIVKGDNNTLNGGDGNDIFEIVGDGNNVDGGLGDNIITIDGKNNNYENISDVTFVNSLSISLQIGDGAFESIDISLDFNLKSLNLDFSDTKSASKGISKLDEMIDEVNLELSNIGATMNRLDSISQLNENTIVNLSSSKSLITDTDVAKEATEYAHSQILQQISTALLSQANIQNSNLISNLLWG